MFNYMLSNIKRPVFRPLKTIASALWHLLLSPLVSAILPFGFASPTSGVYYFILLPILRHLPSCLPVFTSPPSSGFCAPLRCLLFCFSGSAPSSNTCYSTFWFAVPSFIICYSPFRHLLFRLRRCRLLFSFCVIRSKIPPPTPMSDRQKDVFLTQSNHKKSKRSKTACFLLL